MPPLNRKLLYFLRHLSLLVLYFLFFLVQLFFNLDMPKKISGGTVVSTIADAHKKRSAYSQTRNHTSYGKKIRLNKRFQPSVTPGICHDVTYAAYCHLTTPVLGSYVAPYYYSPTLFTRSLRGPPVAV